jgi:hypothetical protein
MSARNPPKTKMTPSTPAGHPAILVEPEGSAPGRGRLRYVVDVEQNGRDVAVSLSEESVRHLDSKHEDVYDADRLLMDISTARWLLEVLPGILARAELAEEHAERAHAAARRALPTSAPLATRKKSAA